MRAELPLAYRVVDRVAQTRDCATLTLEPVRAAVSPYRAGQFMMLYAFGVGEVAISVSGGTCDGGLEHTIRCVGAVSKALHDCDVGAVIGVRGPFGAGWDVERAAGRDVVIVAGGVGLAPLRPLVRDAMAARDRLGRVVLITGARTPDDLLFRDELAGWVGDGRIQLIQTVDAPSPSWTGRVGFVTEPLARLPIDPARTTAYLCGPEPMMRFCAQTLLRKGVSAQDIRVSLERNMQCGIGLCGHCQLGPLLICRDGPVVDYAVAADLLNVREL
jgi:NAD(P)H-flavin reductase